LICRKIDESPPPVANSNKSRQLPLSMMASLARGSEAIFQVIFFQVIFPVGQQARRLIFSDRCPAPDPIA
jgi:hypothetical protein